MHSLLVFKDARDRWLTTYREQIVEYRKKFSPGGPEPLLELTGRNIPEPYRFYRADLASGAVTPPNFTEVNIDVLPSYLPFKEKNEQGIEIAVEPFVWNGVEFDIGGEMLDTMVLADWCLKWLDVPEIHVKDSDGLLGAIHSMTMPEVREEQIHFSVDFGSAPLTAVEELFATLSRVGARTVRITSRWLK